MDDIHGRLREERERLKLSQTAFGALAGASKPSQVRYENGERTPDVRYLSALAKHGVDVMYVLTGQRAPWIDTLRAVQVAVPSEVRELGEVIDSIKRIGHDSPPPKPRDDNARWAAAIAAVEEGLARTGRTISPEGKAELILAAYDLLEEDSEAARSRVIRLVSAA